LIDKKKQVKGAFKKSHLGPKKIPKKGCLLATELRLQYQPEKTSWEKFKFIQPRQLLQKTRVLFSDTCLGGEKKIETQYQWTNLHVDFLMMDKSEQ